MCRILFKKNNQSLFSKEELKYSYQTNPDGTGLIYYDSLQDKMVVKKWLAGTKFDEIYKTIQEVEKNTNFKNIAIHFRIGTSGGKGLDQIHPQEVTEDLFLFHNGICREFECGQNKSDTQWISYWLKDLNFNLEKLNNPIEQQIFNRLFSGNKLLLIEKDKFKLVNEDLGKWEDGIWKSWQYGSKYGWDIEETIKKDSYFYTSAKTSNDLQQRTLFDYNYEPTNKTFKPKNIKKFSSLEENKLLDSYLAKFDCCIIQDLEVIRSNYDEILKNLKKEEFINSENIKVKDKIVESIEFLSKTNQKILAAWDDISAVTCLREEELKQGRKK